MPSHSRILAAALVVLCVAVAAVSAQAAACSSYQELLMYYDPSPSTSCTSTSWYYWGNGTCWSDAVYFTVDGETWGAGQSAMFVANYDDPAASTWSYFDDTACQKRLHGIDGLSCESCISNPSGWILSISGYNITGFNIVSKPTAKASAYSEHSSHASHRHQHLV